MRIALYPGTFDPITYGHLDVIDRARGIFDRLVVAVVRNTAKQPFFSEAERVAMVRAVVRPMRNVSVESFDGLLVDFARARKATAIVRGLRAVSDFEYEFQMALTNRKLAPNVTTVFLAPNERYTYLSSTLVREIALLGGETREFVPPLVRTLLKKKRARIRRR